MDVEFNTKIKLGFYRIDYNYTDYLRQFQQNVQANNIDNHNTAWIGVLVEINGYKYFIPLTSDKNNKQKNSMISHRIDIDSSENASLLDYLGAILFYNMIPVPEGCYEKIDFESQDLPMHYRTLLVNQYTWINIMDNKKTIMNKAVSLRNNRYTTDGRKQLFELMCLDFELLERKCDDYQNM